MSYTPKYTNLNRVRLKLQPRADELSNETILLAIEEAERRTDEFFESCRIATSSLSKGQKYFARNHSTLTACILLISALPTSVEDRRALTETLRNQLHASEIQFIRKQFKVEELKPVYKRIPVKDEEFYKGELENE